MYSIYVFMKSTHFSFHFNETWILPTDFRNQLYIKFDENPSNRITVVPSGETDGQTDMTELIVALRNFANTPKNESLISRSVCRYRHLNFETAEWTCIKFVLFLSVIEGSESHVILVSPVQYPEAYKMYYFSKSRGWVITLTPRQHYSEVSRRPYALDTRWVVTRTCLNTAKNSRIFQHSILTD